MTVIRSKRRVVKKAQDEQVIFDLIRGFIPRLQTLSMYQGRLQLAGFMGALFQAKLCSAISVHSESRMYTVIFKIDEDGKRVEHQLEIPRAFWR